jgi:hypothetical protein
MEKIKIKLGDLAIGLFSSGLSKLTQLNIHSARDAYALMRTEDLLAPEIQSYRKTMLNLLKKHGATSSLAELREAAKAPGLDKPAAAELGKKIAQLEPAETFSIEVEDAGYEAFKAEATDLGEHMVELYLDHRVPVSVASLPDKYFSPVELRALAPIIELTD